VRAANRGGEIFRIVSAWHTVARALRQIDTSQVDQIVVRAEQHARGSYRADCGLEFYSENACRFEVVGVVKTEKGLV